MATTRESLHTHPAILPIVAAVGGLAAVLHGFVAADSVWMLLTHDAGSGAYAARVLGFGALTLLSFTAAVLSFRWPRAWLPALLVGLILLLLAFSDLRSVGLTPV